MNRTLRLACLMLVLTWGGAAQAQYLLNAVSGGQLQIGTGLPLPIGVTGIYLGGMTPVNGGTSCGMGISGCSISPDGPGTAYWPNLLVPPNPAASTMGAGTLTIMATLTPPDPNKPGLIIPPNVLSKAAAGAPVPIAVFPTNPAVMQVATSISYAWPAATATLAPGGGPGMLVTGTGVAGGVITYNMGGAGAAFGGAGQFAIAAGPGAAGGRVPPNALSAAPVASVWINFNGQLPSTVMTLGIVGASNPVGLAQPGAPVASPPGTTMFGPVLNGAMTAANGIGAVNILNSAMTACVAFCMGPAGTVNGSAQPGAPFPSNMVTISKGFPWTTGFLTISQPGAGPPEIFFLSGTDMRVAGIGNVSLVSGSLSARALSGPNANRGWLRLKLTQTPEPVAAVGAFGALAALGLCHGVVRRRRSQ